MTEKEFNKRLKAILGGKSVLVDEFCIGEYPIITSIYKPNEVGLIFLKGLKNKE